MSESLLLAEQDEAFIRGLIEHSVLKDLDSNRLDGGQGAMLVTCSDGNHFHDVFNHHRETKVSNGACQDHRVHPFSWHGGALRLVPRSPANFFLWEEQVWMREIVDGQGRIGYNHIALYNHMPCKKAYLCGISSLQIIAMLMEAKALVKQACPGIVAACFLHVAYRNGERRSYYVDRQAWEEWFVSKLKQLTPTTGLAA